MDSNYVYFRDNLQRLIEDYNGKFIVIKNQSVIGKYNEFEEAYTETLKKEKLGDFIIQHCAPDALEPNSHLKWNKLSFSMATV